MNKIKYCIDCGKKISKKLDAKRCNSCAQIERYKDPKERIKTGIAGTKIDKSILTKKFLYQEYIIKNKTLKTIVKETNICDTTITEYLRKFKISKQKQLRRKVSKQFLIKEYIINKKSSNQIAKELKLASSTIYEFLRTYKIKTRNKSESQIGMKFTKERIKNLSLSQGGTGIPRENSEYGAEFDNALKEQVRFRDKYICQECGCSQLENGRQLDCHHIDYDKKNNVLNNLISLCRKCHMETNYNREQWEAHFKEKISKKRSILK